MPETHHRDGAKAAVDRIRFGNVAKEEFWIVTRSFFAPIYGTVIVLKQLLKVAQQMDSGHHVAAGKTAAEDPGDSYLMPAE